jgi:NADH-quinone oxidoreductase subunit A
VTTLVEMFVFLGFIALGILYAWRKRVLSWT